MSSQTSSATTVLPSVIADDGSGGGSGGDTPRTDPDRWYFPKEKLETTPSRRSGIDPDKELTYRQQSANFIQDIGQRLQVNQLCINTAIVYMHRFYMFHSFTQFHRNSVSAASIFLAAKVEEQPRKLEHVIKVAHYCLHRDHPQIDTKSEQYLEQSAELVMNENILLQTLGFDVAIDHPHTHVVKCCQLVRASKDLAQTSYFMATNSLHLTTMCLQYKPTVVACVCIHLACKWSRWEIPRSKEGKDWFWYVDDTVTTELLEKLTTDFLLIFNKSPSRLKKKISSLSNASSASLSLTNVPYHGFDSSPGQPHQARSRSPSPKRPGGQKPSSSQQPGMPGKTKPPGMPMPHHPMKPGHYPPPGSAPGSKHSSSHMMMPSSSHPSHSHPSGHSSSGKPPHPGMPPGSMKDPHHPHHSQHTKNPYHGQHVAHGQYPHGSRPGIPPSGSSQSHHGHGMHSKPPPPGSSSSSSSSSSAHPYSTASGSSQKNMQTHNPSKPHNMPPSGVTKMPPTQVPGGPVKNPNQSMYHSSQSHMKKPYSSETRPDFGMSKREGPSSGSMHHSQNHNRAHDKLADVRHHSSSSGLSQSQSGSSQQTADSRGASHHGVPYLNQDMERSGGLPNQKLPYMDSRSLENSADINRHRVAQPPESKRPHPHGGATNGSNNEAAGLLGTSGGSGSGAGDSHVPSKNAYSRSSTTSSTFGQNSQLDMGAKFHADGFGGNDFGSGFGGSSNILSIEDRRKRRHADSLSMGSSSATAPNSKRPRSDAYSAVPVPTLSANSLFSPEELNESASKRLPTAASQFSPSASEGTQPSYSKAPDRSQMGGNAYGGSGEGITFGSTSDSKSDIRKINPAEFQAPDLLQPINDVSSVVKNEPLSTGGDVSQPPPRAASLFSPEFIPSNSVPATLNIPSGGIDIHKRDIFSSVKQESTADVSISQHNASGYSDGGSQLSFTGRLSNSPKRGDDTNEDDSHSSKKSKKKKEKHHKHKHKEEKKHKKDKYKDKEKDKEKKDRHRSKDKHSAPVEVTNDTKIKIKLGPGRDDNKSTAVTTVQHSSRHLSSKMTNSSANQGTPVTTALAGLKVKISSKGRVSSVDEDAKHDVPSKQDPSPTPCCPGFGPCLTCNRESSSDQFSYFSPAPPLMLKIPKNKEPSRSSKESPRESRRSKEKSSKSSSGSSSSSSAYHSVPSIASGRPLPSGSNHYVHKNGVEKPSKKKEKSATLL